MPDLTALGWDDARAEQFEPHADAGVIPGRVAVQHRGAYDVLTELGELRCDVAGRLYDGSATADLPAVGDWVAIAPRPERAGRHDPGRPSAPHEVLAQDRVAGGRGAGPRRERRRRAHRHLAQRGPEPAPARALPHARLGERCAAGVRADQGRPRRRRRRRRRRGRVDRVRRPVVAISNVTGRRPRRAPLAPRARASPLPCSARPASASRRSSTRSPARSCSRPGRSATTARAATRRPAASSSSCPAARS